MSRISKPFVDTSLNRPVFSGQQNVRSALFSVGQRVNHLDSLTQSAFAPSVANIDRAEFSTQQRSPQQELDAKLPQQLRSDYADLCKATNRKFKCPSATLPPGYSLAEHIDTDNGFNASVFIGPQGPIMVCEGTDLGEYKDVVQNDYQAILRGDKIAPQLYCALEAYDNIEQKYGKPTVIGHSLGAYLAQGIGGLRDAKDVVAFNGPGAKGAIEQLRQLGYGKGQTDQVVNIINDKDPIATLISSDANMDGKIDRRPDLVAGHETGRNGGVYVYNGDSSKEMFANHTDWDGLAAAQITETGDDAQRYTRAFSSSMDHIGETAMTILALSGQKTMDSIGKSLNNAKDAVVSFFGGNPDSTKEEEFVILPDPTLAARLPQSGQQNALNNLASEIKRFDLMI